MLGIGEGELVLILLFAFLVFGPDKLPGMGRTIGRALRQFKNAQEGFTQVVQTEIVDPATEAMSDNPKRPNRKRSAEFEEDADIEDGAEGAAEPRRAETFAERKKRLAAEKAARDAEAAERARAAAAATAEAPDPDDAVDSDDDADPDAAPEPTAPVETEKPEPTAPKKPSAADLYAMRPAPRPAVEEPAGDAAEADGAVDEPAAAEPADVAPAEPEKEA